MEILEHYINHSEKWMLAHWLMSVRSQVTSNSEVAQSCPTLCDPMDCSLSGSSVHGIFQARVLEWVAISFSMGSSRPRDQIQVSHIAGRHFTVWATREVQYPIHIKYNEFLLSLLSVPFLIFLRISCGILYFHWWKLLLLFFWKLFF